MKKNLIVLQEGKKDCGAACLLSIIRYYGGDISLERLISYTETDKDGTNFYNLSLAGEKLGLNARAYEVDTETKISEIEVPFIVQLSSDNMLHFVVVYKVHDTKVIVMDPSVGKKVIDLFDFSNMWTGNILIFDKVKMLPIYKKERILNNIIFDVIYKNKSTILFLLILSLIFTFLSCFGSFYSQVIFDRVLDTTIENINIVTILFSVLYIIKLVTNYVRNILIIFFNQKIDISIIISTFSKVILLPYYYYKNKTTGEVLSRINDLFSLKMFISKVIITIFLDITTFIISFFILYFLNTKVLFTLFIVCFIYLIAIILFNYPIKIFTEKVQESTSIINSYIVESINAFESIKNLNIEDNIVLNFSKKYTSLINNVYIREKIENIIVLIKDIVTDIGILLVSYLVIRLVLKGDLTVGNYMTISILANYFMSPFKNILDLMGEFHYIKNSINRANNLLSVDEEEIYNRKNLIINGNIAVKNLSYSYNNKYKVFDNISFYIRDRDRTLILGNSGSGKSTLMKLLYGYYKTERDNIFINGFDINDYSLGDLRNNITYISQNEMLFTSSIRDNIIMDRNISEERFLKVCNLLSIDEIIKDNVLGYDYVLEENGINLSGGQRQRIILARGLLKESNIVLIDEGLNEIDISLERKILINIFNEFRDKTFIIISHRENNMDLYNRLIKFDNGKLVNYERGET